MPADDAARQLQAQADGWAAALPQLDPPAAGSDLAWQQEMIRDAYADAAHMGESGGGR